MPQSDQMVERVYDLVNRQQSERVRAEVARAALLAAEYRASHLKAVTPAESGKEYR